MARVRLGGHDPVLSSAHARGGSDQIEPPEAHRRRDGLAVRQRAQEGAKGMITRRDLLRGVAGTAGLLGWPPGHASGEPPPETTRIRVVRSGAICISPLYVAEELFRLEGFTDVEYVEFKTGNLFTQAVGAGQVGLGLEFIGPLVVT